VWERRGEYRRVEEKRGKVRKWMDVPLQVAFGVYLPSEEVCAPSPWGKAAQRQLQIG
jgi:hypothetical protein